MTLLVLGSILFLGSQLIAAFGYRAKVEAMGGHHALSGAGHCGFDDQLDIGRYGLSASELSAALASAPCILSIGHLSDADCRHILLRAMARQYWPLSASMLTGIALWAFLHLLANGDLSSTIIFITFGGYAIYLRLTLQPKAAERQPIYRDMIAITGGLLVFGLFYYFHEALSGVGLS